MRTRRRRPRNAEASRLVTWAWQRASDRSRWGGHVLHEARRRTGPGCPLPGTEPSAGCVIDATPARPEAYSRQVQGQFGGLAGLFVPEVAGQVEQPVRDSCTTSSMRSVGTVGLADDEDHWQPADSACASRTGSAAAGSSDASTSRTTPSTIDSPRSTSPPKSASRGADHVDDDPVPSGWRRCTAVFFARIVMPFSRSRGRRNP